MAGGTMGWFTYQNYKKAFFDPANSREVAYIQRLSQARIAGKAWMVHGRATRTLQLNDPTSALLGQCFLRDKENESHSVVCAVALPTASPAAATYTLSMIPAKYGLTTPVGSRVFVTDLVTGASLGSYAPALPVTYSSSVPAFGVQLLKLTVELQSLPL